jgi:hypothetical protein
MLKQAQCQHCKKGVLPLKTLGSVQLETFPFQVCGKPETHMGPPETTNLFQASRQRETESFQVRPADQVATEEGQAQSCAWGVVILEPPT